MTKIAIIGDRFMESSVFEREIHEKCGSGISFRSMDLPWPDVPMEHGYNEPSPDGLKEFMGTSEMVVSNIENATILVTHLAPVTKGVFDQVPQLKFVAVARGGPVNVDITDAKSRGIKVVNTPGRNASAVAEFTIGAIIAHTRNIVKGHEALRKGVYRGDLYRSDVVGNELSDSTVGVVGYGFIGSKVVKLLQSFGSNILVSDPFVKLNDADIKYGVNQVELETLISESDIITLHSRVTDQTIGLFGETEFGAMKPGAVLVNTARGPLMDYKALYGALTSGHLSGAVLETFSIEPVLPNDPLLQLPNVLLTPHIAGASHRTVRVAAKTIAEEIHRYLHGETALNPC